MDSTPVIPGPGSPALNAAIITRSLRRTCRRVTSTTTGARSRKRWRWSGGICGRCPPHLPATCRVVTRGSADKFGHATPTGRCFCRGAKILNALHVLPLLERKHRAVAEATALLDWRLAPVWQQARAELAKHTRKPDQGMGPDAAADGDAPGRGRRGAR